MGFVMSETTDFVQRSLESLPSAMNLGIPKGDKRAGVFLHHLFLLCIYLQNSHIRRKITATIEKAPGLCDL